MNWESAKKTVRERDDWTCRKCAYPGSDVHHRLLRGMGGTSDPEVNTGLANLVTLCRFCHDYVHAHPAWSYVRGWLVHSWDKPEDIPLFLPQGEIFLRVDGTVDEPDSSVGVCGPLF